MRASISFSQFQAEVRKRWLIFVLFGIYLLVGGLFATLIYGFGWDQTATRWAALIYPLPAARINGDTIWLSSYYRRLKIYEHYDQRVELEQPNLLPNDPFERKTRVMDELVQVALIEHEAKQAGISVSQEEIDTTFNQVVEANGGAENFEKVLADFYGITPAEFAREFIPEQLYRQKIQDQLFTQVHVRHIVLADQAAAQQVLDRVKAGEDFTELSKNFSQDVTTREQGGDLGWVRRGELVPSFEDAAFALPVGGVTDTLVKSDFGYHIIKVDERKDGVISDQSYSQWFANLNTKAEITRYVPKEPKAEPEPSPEPTAEPTETPAETPAA